MKKPSLIYGLILFAASHSAFAAEKPAVPAMMQKPQAQATGAQRAAVGAPLPSSPAPTAALPRSDSPIDAIMSEDLIRALRDPFQLPSILMTRKETPKTDLEIYPLKDFKLNGVVTGPKKTRAMVTTPNNKVYFIKMGDKIGARDGKVSQISPDSIRVTEYYTDEHGVKLPDIYELKMSGELVSLSKREGE